MANSGLSKTLSLEEKSNFANLERVIEIGFQSLLATGSALKEIRDGRLYRESHKTFESYIKARWSIECRQAYRLIDASEVKQELLTISSRAPKASEITREGQLRELSGVPSEALERVVERATEIAGDLPLTAKILKQARKQVLLDPEEEAERNDEHSQPVKEDPAEVDEEPDWFASISVGSQSVEAEPKTETEGAVYEDPDWLKPGFFDDEPQVTGPMKWEPWFKEQLRLLGELKSNMASVDDSPGMERLAMRDKVVMHEIDRVISSFEAAAPHAICPRCNGKNCPMCGNLGWVNKSRFDELARN